MPPYQLFSNRRIPERWKQRATSRGGSKHGRNGFRLRGEPATRGSSSKHRSGTRGDGGGGGHPERRRERERRLTCGIPIPITNDLEMINPLLRLPLLNQRPIYIYRLRFKSLLSIFLAHFLYFIYRFIKHFFCIIVFFDIKINSKKLIWVSEHWVLRENFSPIM